MLGRVGIIGVTLTLDVDAPFGRVETECFEGALLAEALGFVDVCVAAIVAGAGVAFGVFIWSKRSDMLFP